MRLLSLIAVAAAALAAGCASYTERTVVERPKPVPVAPAVPPGSTVVYTAPAS